MKPGDLIEPRSTTGASAYMPDATHYTPERVYLTGADHLAERYAVGRAGRQGGQPRIYEVEPVGAVTPDPEYAASGFGSDQVVVERARVVREVPLPGLVHWDSQKQQMMRGPKPPDPLDGLTIKFETAGGEPGMPQTFRWMIVEEPATEGHREGWRVGLVSYRPSPEGIQIDSVAVEQGQQGKGIAQAMMRELHERVAVNNEPLLHGNFSTTEGVRFGFRMASLHPEWNKLWLDYEDGKPVFWVPGTPVTFTDDTETRPQVRRLGDTYEDPNHDTFAPIKYGNYAFVQQAIDQGMRTPGISGPEVEKPDDDLGLDYRIEHTSPDPEGGVPMHDLTGGTVYPDDFYDRATQLRYYGTGEDEHDPQTFAVVNSVRGDPDAMVTIYRGVPGHVSEINPGDWVTPSQHYGELNAWQQEDEGGHVLSMEVRAGDLYTQGDSIHEWGWHPGGTPAAPSDDSSQRVLHSERMMRDTATEALPAMGMGAEKPEGAWEDVLPEGYSIKKPPPLAASTRKGKWKREWFFMLRDLHEQGGFGWQRWGSGHQSSGITNALWKRGAIQRGERKNAPLLFRLTPKGRDELMGFYEDWRGVDFDPPEPPLAAPVSAPARAAVER